MCRIAVQEMRAVFFSSEQNPALIFRYTSRRAARETEISGEEQTRGSEQQSFRRDAGAASANQSDQINVNGLGPRNFGGLVVHVLVVALVAQRALIRIRVGIRHRIRAGFQTVFAEQRHREVPTAHVRATGRMRTVARNAANLRRSRRAFIAHRRIGWIFERHFLDVRRRGLAALLIQRTVIQIVGGGNRAANGNACRVNQAGARIVEITVAVRTPSAHAAEIGRVAVLSAFIAAAADTDCFRCRIREFVQTVLNFAFAIEQAEVLITVRVVTAGAAQHGRREVAAGGVRQYGIRNGILAGSIDVVTGVSADDRAVGTAVTVIDIVFRQENKISGRTLRRIHRISAPHTRAVARQAHVRRGFVLQQIRIPVGGIGVNRRTIFAVVHGMASIAMRYASIMQR